MGKMQKKLYSEQKNNINFIRKQLGLDKMYLYRYIGNCKKIKRMPYEIVLGIANIEKIEPDELYSKMIGFAIRNNEGE